MGGRVTDRARRRRGVDVLLAVLRERACLGHLTAAEWGVLIPAAEAARLLPRLAIDAERTGLASTLPGWVRDRLTSSRVRGHAFERAVLWEIDRVHRALLPVGVRPVFLKGAGYIAAGLSCGVGRVVADVDILIPEADLRAVQAALQQHGWQFESLNAYDERYYREWMHELPPMRHRARGTMLDVHHRILPRTGRVHPSTERLLEEAVDTGGTRVLAPAHMVLHSAAHIFQDGEVGGALRDVVDLRDLFEQFGQDATFEGQLVAEAETLELGRSLFYAARYARLVGCHFRPEVERWHPPMAALPLMDTFVERALIQDSRVGRWAMFVRSHWLRMPALMLARHLGNKALR